MRCSLRRLPFLLKIFLFFKFYLFVASDRGTSRHTCAQNNVKQQHISASSQAQCVQLDTKSSRETSRVSCESPWKVSFCSMYHFTNKFLNRQEPCSQILVSLIRMNLTRREHSHLKYSESVNKKGTEYMVLFTCRICCARTETKAKNRYFLHTDGETKRMPTFLAGISRLPSFQPAVTLQQATGFSKLQRDLIER